MPAMLSAAFAKWEIYRSLDPIPTKQQHDLLHFRQALASDLASTTLRRLTRQNRDRAHSQSVYRIRFQRGAPDDAPIVVVAGSQNPWPRRRKIELADLVDGPDSASVGHGSRFNHQETFRGCGLPTPQGVVMSASLQLIARLQSGPYLAMWPASVLRFGAKYLSLRVLPSTCPSSRDRSASSR